MAWIDIAVSTVGILGGVVRGTDAGREPLSGGAETDSEASYRPKTRSALKIGSALRKGRYSPGLGTGKESGCRRRRLSQTYRGGC
jgi:hypothetical protein